MDLFGVLDPEFKAKMWKRKESVCQVPSVGIEGVLNIFDDFDLCNLQCTGFRTPMLVKNKGNLQVRLPEQTPCNLQFLKDCYGDESSFPASFSNNYIPISSKKVISLKSLEKHFMMEYGERKESLLVDNIKVPNGGQRRQYLPPTPLDKIDLNRSVSSDMSNYNSMTRVVSKNYFIQFGRNITGMFQWYHQFTGSQIVFLVEPRVDDAIVLEEYNKCLGRKDSSLFPPEFENRVFARKVSKGETLLLPGNWAYAVLTLEDSIIYYGSVLVTELIPEHIRAHKADLLVSNETRAVHEKFDDVMEKAFPKILEQLHKMMYYASPHILEHAQNVITSYLGRYSNFLDPALLSVFKDMPKTQIKLRQEGLCKHITGVVFKASQAKTLQSHLSTGLLCNIKVGETYRPSIIATQDDNDFSKKCMSNYKQVKFDDFINVIQNNFVIIELDNEGSIHARALTDIQPNTYIGEIRGEVLTDAQLQIRYATLYPPGEIYHLTNNEKEDIWIDSNYFHGMNSFFKTRGASNCRTVKSHTKSTIKLLIATTRRILKGEELTLPPNANDDVTEDEPYGLSTHSLDSRRDGYLQFESKELFEEWNETRKAEKNIKTKYICMDINCTDVKINNKLGLYNKHLQWFHVPYPRVCPICKKGYVKRSDMEKHISRH